MSYLNSRKFEYILDENDYKTISSETGKIFFVDFYRNCGNSCLFCPNQKLIGNENAKILINVACLHFISKNVASGDEIVFGSLSDPYQIVEAEHKLMRMVLEMILARNIYLNIITKSDLILRDMDLFSEIAESGRIKIFIEAVSASRNINQYLEKHAPDFHLRMKIIARLAKNNIDSGVYIRPIIPGITSRTEIIAILRLVKKSGGRFVVYDYFSVNEHNRDTMRQVISSHFRDKLGYYENHIDNEAEKEKYILEMDSFISEVSSFQNIPCSRMRYRLP